MNWGNLKWRKQNWYNPILNDLKMSGNEISMGDRILIMNSIDHVVENYLKITGECPPTSPAIIMMVYDRLFSFGFRSNWVEKEYRSAKLIECAYRKIKPTSINQL